MILFWPLLVFMRLCAHDVVSRDFHFEIFQKVSNFLAYFKPENEFKPRHSKKNLELHAMNIFILDLHVSHVGGEAQEYFINYSIVGTSQHAWASNIFWCVSGDWLKSTIADIILSLAVLKKILSCL